MSVRRLAEVQPESFEFTPENRAWAEKEVAKYPQGRQASAVISLLWRAQEQSGSWLPRPAIEKVADILGMPYIRALEIATFYTMFNLEPVGRHHVQLCGTTPCQLRGAEAIKQVCKNRIGAERQVTADGAVSWVEVECLGACCNAPVAQINDDFYEDLTPENFAALLDDLAAGRPVKTGSQTGRVSSEPEGGLTTLTTLYGADGHSGPGVASAAPAANDDAAAVEAHAAAEEAHIRATLATLPKDATSEQKADAVGSRPVGLVGARAGRADDMQRVQGRRPDQREAPARTRRLSLRPDRRMDAPGDPLGRHVSVVSGSHRPRTMGEAGGQPRPRRRRPERRGRTCSLARREDGKLSHA